MDMDDRARAILADSGYHMPHSARQFDPDWFHERDLVLALDNDNYERLAQLHPGATQRSCVCCAPTTRS